MTTHAANDEDRRSPRQAAPKQPAKNRSRIRAMVSSFGPGVITGAADDDPAGIATYSVAGAQFGVGLLYTAFLTWPLMAAVQTMCARIGMVTGRGLIANFRKKFPRSLLTIAAMALFGANALNVGADLAGMGDAASMITHVDAKVFVVLFGCVIAIATVKLRYQTIARWLKWLALVLFAYVACAFIVVRDWKSVVAASFLPHWPADRETWKTIVAILGTTISPYLFFWQTSQEVEEEKSLGRRSVNEREGATETEVACRNWDVRFGTFFSNVVMYFIILTTAVTLHANNETNIETSRQAAEALRPLAGNVATLLYTIGVVGVGFLAIPTLAGSSAYALAETFGWRQGLDEKPRTARQFYIAIGVSMLIGILFDFVGFNPIQALFWSSVVNGLLAPFLLIGILLIASDATIMRSQPSSRTSRLIVVVTATAMFAAGAGLILL